MARTNMEALEHKIERAQEQVSRTKKQYDAAIAALSDLLDKRDALKRDELVKAIMKSDKTYDEVLAFLSKLIQKDCCFNKKMADTLADIVLSLHSRENEAKWKGKDKAGLEKFRKEELYVKWEGSATWKTSGGGVDCYYAADIVIKPTKALVINDKLSRSLKKNPFMKTEDIGKIYERDLKGYLDCEFEDHCTCDDYYQPVVEDFELEAYLKDWCDKNGFKIVSCESDGGDNGYEPDSVRKWFKY